MSSDTITNGPTAPETTKTLAERILPKFEIVANLKALEKIEDRQRSLGSVTKEILKSRELAHQNMALK
ncbi:MAG: hypothetical protein JST89_19700 [Cyanobacteria bacterium SZAS-4]|nr:hypothetical protein [Cyanobacteria bacterium SZAS-4]